MSIRKIIAILLALLCLASLAACGKSGSAPSPFATMDTVDVNGNQVTSDFFAQHKLTLVNVWILNCNPCIEEIPILDKLNDEYADKGVAVLGLYYDTEAPTGEDREKFDDIMEGLDLTQIILSEDMKSVRPLKHVFVFPSNFYVDSEGNIILTSAGSDSYEGWAAALDKQLAKLEEAND